MAIVEPISDDEWSVEEGSREVRTAPSSSVSPPKDVLAIPDSSVPPAFLCPLSLEIMYDPVCDEQGNSFERRPLMKWLRERKISPISRKPLTEASVIPNNALRDVIRGVMGTEWARRKAEQQAKLEKEEDGVSIEKTSCPYRAKVDGFLQMIRLREEESLGGLDLQLNEKGTAAFRFNKAVFVIDVPEKSGIFRLYTRELIMGQVTDVMKDRLLELNFLQSATRGGCLSIKKHSAKTSEVVFSYQAHVDEVGSHDFRNVVFNFVETAASLRKQIVADPSPEHQERDCKRQRTSACSS